MRSADTGSPFPVILQQMHLHPWLLLLSVVLCLPALPLLVRVFLPARVRLFRAEDDDSGFFSTWNWTNGWGGWIELLPLLFLFWPLIRFMLFIATYALLSVGIFCGLMAFLR